VSGRGCQNHCGDQNEFTHVSLLLFDKETKPIE
jgi:hypothetical protein